MTRGNSEDLARLLRSRIQDGIWVGGQRIPTERALAEELGVARNTVRRALDQLEQETVVTRHIGRGTFVRSEAPESALRDVVERMKMASPSDMMDLRLLLEPAAAGYAATNAGAAEIADIRAAHDKACAAVDMPEFEEWDTELHRLIFSCTRNDLLREVHEILRVLRQQPQWFEMKRHSFSEERRRTYCTQHEAIVAAIERRLGGEARDAMRAHLLTVQENMLGR